MIRNNSAQQPDIDKMRRPRDSNQLLFIATIVLILNSGHIISSTMAINSVLDLNGTYPYLINNSTGQIIEPRDYMDFENLFAPNDTYKATQTAQGRNYHLIKAFDFANYYQSDYWHYSNEADLKNSAKPVANPTKCSQQLEWLEGKLHNSAASLFKPGQQHVNLMSLIDSFGHPEASTYQGHAYWMGSYHGCLKVSIDQQQFEREERCSGADCLGAQLNISTQQSRDGSNKMRFRYCIGKARDKDWPTFEQDNYVPKISYKIGLCLPETCETLSYARHGKQIENMMRLNLPDYTRDRIELYELYCLPDNRSPLRQLSTSSKIYLTICTGWLLMLAFATIIYSFYKSHQQDIRKILSKQIVAETAIHQQRAVATATQIHSGPLINPPLEQQVVGNGLSAIDCVKVPNCCVEAEQNDQNDIVAKSKALLHICKSPNIVAAKEHIGLAPLSDGWNDGADVGANGPGVQLEDFDSPDDMSSSTVSLSNWLNDSPFIIRLLQALSVEETIKEFQQPPELLRVPGANKRLRINLNALDSIKCLCCILVIFGHIVFIHMQHLSNIAHTIELSHQLYPRVLISFFNFVDTFFIISGMLTSYFILKRFNKKTFSNPLVWVSISLLRLLRLSPVYILVFWFIKTTGVYLTDGPIWDYGTDKNSIKGLCMNDHWWKSLLYLGNLGTMQPLCILPAWSIIVDSQYSLIVPPIMFLIFKNKRLGYLTLLVAIIVSTTKMSFQLANQTAVKASDMAKIRLHVYPLISRFAAEFYNTAWNRIGPVAIGIMGGHALYMYDVKKIRQWPWFMKGVIFKIVLLLHLFIFVLPIIGRYTDDPESRNETDMTMFILSNASIKPIWSLINTIFLLRLITDLRSHSFLARLMSHNLWHCLGKLCFTSYLIHYEVILTLLKSRQEGLIDPNWSNALREFSTVFLISTLLSYFIYVLYEAPMNKLIMLFFSKQSNKLKKPVSQAGQNGDETQNNTNNMLKISNYNGTQEKIYTQLYPRPNIEYNVITKTSERT